MLYLRALVLLLSVVGIVATTQAQDRVLVNDQITITTANERTTLDRRTRLLHSQVDITLENISANNLEGPLHVAFPLSDTRVSLDGGLGGPNEPPYQAYYLDVSDLLTDGILAPAVSISFQATFTSPVRFTYRMDVYAAEPVVEVSLPPDPATIAPSIDSTTATTIFEATNFLYTGPEAIQTGVEPETIESKRVAVIRGRVLSATDATPLGGVLVTVFDHPEYGQTLSRADGQFDLVVNGGSQVFIELNKTGFPMVQRGVDVKWQAHHIVDDVVMTPLDTQVTTIDLTNASVMQVAQASIVTDSDGSRQNTLLFPAGTQANIRLPNGSLQPVTTLNVRATEYTVGPHGPKAMPGDLPPTSGYTYAVEFSVDEALALSATHVEFDQPVINYVENFLGFAIGTTIPVGYYEPEKCGWVPADNGRVIQILSLNNGIAELDIEGNGVAATPTELAAWGITTAEQQQLATLYTPGQSLWRVTLAHFSSVDYNLPSDTPDDAEEPSEEAPEGDDELDEPACEGGSIIECQNQVLRERLPIAGTPLTLNYRSDRVPGRLRAYSLDISLSGTSVPASLKAIQMDIHIAGQYHTQRFTGAAEQQTTFTWDGFDAYGRRLQGQQPVTVWVGYVYDAEYYEPADVPQAFGVASGGDGSRNSLNIPARQEIILWRGYRTVIGAMDARSIGLGAWSLDIHHSYSPVGQILYRGDGQRRSAADQNNIITTIAGNGSSGFSGDGGLATEASLRNPEALAVGPDGSVYILDEDNDRIRKVDSAGIITTVAGNGNSGFSGDGGFAINAAIEDAEGIAVGHDNSLYIANDDYHRIRKVDPNGIITTMAGTGVSGFSGDGGLAINAWLNDPHAVAVADDCTVYIADTNNNRIRRIGPDGIITTVAGNGIDGDSGDGGPAILAALDHPRGIAIADNGDLYIADTDNHRIRRVDSRGVITTVAGNGIRQFSGDGGLATLASLKNPESVAIAPDGSLYISDESSDRIRRVAPNGMITTIAGDGTLGDQGDGGAATAAPVEDPEGIALGPDGSLYIANDDYHRIRKVSAPLPKFDATEIAIASDDGQQLYQFDSTGRHLQTINTLTNAILYQFSYDGNGYLSQITDGDGNITTIERETAGQPSAIVSTDGQRTTLSLEANGYLASISNPATETTTFSYTTDGLLTGLEDPRNGMSTISYDAMGRLAYDENAAGGFWDVTRTELNNGYEVTMTSGEGRATVRRVETLANGDERRVTITPFGTQSETILATSDTDTLVTPEGVITTVQQGPDPRFGMQAPFNASVITELPSGLRSTVTQQRTVNLADVNDPLSLTQQTDVIDVNGRIFTQVYDATTLTRLSISPESRQLTETIDTQNRVTQSLRDGLAAINYDYDSRGRLETITQGPGIDTRVYQFQYDSDGFLQTITDPLTRNMVYEYDPVGRVTRQTLPDGRFIDYSYNANGDLSTLMPPGKSAHVFDYDAIGQETDYTPPALSGIDTITRYQYNLDKQLILITRPDVQAIDFIYDTGGRLITMGIPRGDYRYDYDVSTSQLTTLTAPDNSTLSYTYDGILVTSETLVGEVDGTVSWDYDTDFRVINRRVNSAGIVFNYDDDSLLTQAGNLTLTRDTQNGLLSGTALGSLSTARSYNLFAELSQVSANHGANNLYTVDYTRDALGRITNKTESLGGVATTFDYDYDVAGRLVTVAENGLTVSTYTYDSNSNRLSHNATTGTYDEQDRLLSYGNTAFSYTLNGELASQTQSGQTTTYQYDVIGNLTQVTLSDSTTIDYVIDARNRRVGKKINGTLVQGFLYQDQLNPVAELDSNGNVITDFVYASRFNVPDYMIKAGVTYRIISDHLGSPRLVVDISTGAIVQRMDYDEFGKVTVDTNPGFQPFGFAGGVYDQHTQFTRFGARDYNAVIGRWTSKDPIRFDGGDANLYGYVLGDPVNFVDVDGRSIAGLTPAVLPSRQNNGSQMCPTPSSGNNQLNENLTDKIGEISKDTGLTPKQVKDRIHGAKENLPKGTNVRNPDVVVDTGTGEIYPKTPDGSYGDSIGNIFD